MKKGKTNHYLKGSDGHNVMNRWNKSIHTPIPLNFRKSSLKKLIVFSTLLKLRN